MQNNQNIKKYYKINGGVIFFPEDSYILSSSGQKVKLNVPTNNLFKVFISRVDETIPQNELYSLAWGEAGANVTPNALYQNISLLRKAMQDAGLDGECLKTIRGKGFIFTALNVTEHNTEDHNDSSVKKNWNIYIILIALVGVLSIATIIVLSKLEEKKFSAVKNEFAYFSKIDNCKVYVSPKSNGNEDNLNAIFSKKSSSCIKFPFVYIQLTGINTPISITSCKKDILSKNNACITELIYNFKRYETNEKQ